MKLIRKAGVTSEIFQIFIRDSSSTTGGGLTGLTNASSGLTAYYNRDTDASPTAITLVSMTAGTFTSSGFKEISSANLPGWYQFCPPNAALASGAKSCAFHLKGATNMAPLPIEVELVAVDVDDTVRFGLTALPNVAIGSANGLTRSSDGSASTITSGVIDSNVTKLLGTAWLTPGTAGTPDVNVKLINAVTTAPITTINANLGTTQPMNFTGVGGSALVKTDMIDIASAVVSTSTAQLGVNVVSTASAERDAIAAALLDLANGVETSRTVRKALRLMLAAMAGKLSGAGTTSVAIRDTGDTKNRISATVDASGNRSTVTLDDT